MWTPTWHPGDGREVRGRAMGGMWHPRYSKGGTWQGPREGYIRGRAVARGVHTWQGPGGWGAPVDVAAPVRHSS